MGNIPLFKGVFAGIFPCTVSYPIDIQISPEKVFLIYFRYILEVQIPNLSRCLDV